MNDQWRLPRARHPWTWPAVIGLSSTAALIVALVVDGSWSWDALCWAVLVVPFVLVARALWRRRAG